MPKRLPERVETSSEIHALEKVDLPFVKTHVAPLIEVDKAGIEGAMICRR